MVPCIGDHFFFSLSTCLVFICTIMGGVAAEDKARFGLILVLI